MFVRRETQNDLAAVHALNVAAFGSPAEADLVDALREAAEPAISLVAEDGGRIVGHIMFSPVKLDGHADLLIMGLGPMAVLPDRQREGIGGELVRQGLDRCREMGYGAVVLVGHAEYYPRFGFVPSIRFGLSCEYDVPEDVFMVTELQPGYLCDRVGTIRYHTAFGEV